MKRWKRMVAATLALAVSAACVGGAGAVDVAGDGTESGAAESYETTYVDPPSDYESDGTGAVNLIGAAFVNNEYFEYGFELPVTGATGWGVTGLNLRARDDVKSARFGVVKAGVAFEILGDGENYFHVRVSDGREGWVSKTYTMINLPDVVPSAVYDATNSDSSKFRTLSGDLPGVTGKILYDVSRENARLGRTEYDMPVLFSTAVKVAAAQRAALVAGDTLVIHETYRPMSVQTLVRNALASVMNGDAAVRADVESWGTSWFIATGVSNHQRGYALDVSLARVEDVTTFAMGDYVMNVPGAVSLREMPTDVHELSTRAASLVSPVTSLSATAWRDVETAGTMTEGALALREYMTAAGFTPLASEWWHFNDLDARAATGGSGTGQFQLAANVSAKCDVEIELPLVSPSFVYIAEDVDYDEDEPALMVVPEGAQGLVD